MSHLVGVGVRKIVTLGDKVLRAPTRKLSALEIVSPEVQRLLEEMAITMHEYEGVGIAATQVGEGLSLFMMGLAEKNPRHPPGIPLSIVCNPEVRFPDDETELDWEGCLSVPGLRGQVERHKRVELSGLDHKGKPFTCLFEGFPARVIQHEWDHLNGKVYLDRMTDLLTLCCVGR